MRREGGRSRAARSQRERGTEGAHSTSPPGRGQGLREEGRRGVFSNSRKSHLIEDANSKGKMQSKAFEKKKRHHWERRVNNLIGPQRQGKCMINICLQQTADTNTIRGSSPRGGTVFPPYRPRLCILIHNKATLCGIQGAEATGISLCGK